ALAWFLAIAQADAAKRTACCAWNDKSVAALENAVAEADRHGIRPDQLGLETLDLKVDRKDRKREARLTDIALRYAALLNAEASKESKQRQALARALHRGNLADWFDSLAPKSSDYKRLKDALADYRRIADAGGWEEINVRRKLKPGTKSKSVLALKRRLA